VSEIDVQSVELLPGASSALYGANAFNGILFMNSKSPFTSPGITAYAKFGQTSQKQLVQTTMLITELEWRI
jgi:outer membrane receptor protein involved in Fe transport